MPTPVIASVKVMVRRRNAVPEVVLVVLVDEVLEDVVEEVVEDVVVDDVDEEVVDPLVIV